MVGREPRQAQHEGRAVGRAHVARAAVREGDLLRDVHLPELGHSAGVYTRTHRARP